MAETGNLFRLAPCQDNCRYRCQSVPVRERPALRYQAHLAKSSRAASRRRTIRKVFCGTRRARLSATKGHALEGACMYAGAFHAAFSERAVAGRDCHQAAF